LTREAQGFEIVTGKKVKRQQGLRKERKRKSSDGD